MIYFYFYVSILKQVSINRSHSCHCQTDLDITAVDVHTTDYVAVWGVPPYHLYPVDHLLLIVKVQSRCPVQVLSHHSSCVSPVKKKALVFEIPLPRVEPDTT